MMQLTPQLSTEYRQLFASCTIRPERLNDVRAIADKLVANRSRYAAVGDPLAIPWYFIAVVHNLEASLSFTTHLHNGDPLSARTVHVPAGRPVTGTPPFSWEVSARDALRQRGLADKTDWGLAATLFRLEGYNGFGYRTLHTGINTPYLWSFSHHYERGKFVADHVFSPTKISQQCGAATLLRRLLDTGAISLPQ